MKYFVYPYTSASKSAKALAEALGGKRVLLSGSVYKYSDDHVLINWGAGECPHKQALNAEIMDVIDKVRFFKRLKGTGLTPDYATTIEGAKKLGYPVFCRTTTQGHDGNGIKIADCDGQIVSAPLYVKGIDKTSEYRVHVGRKVDGTIVIIGGSKKMKLAITPAMTNVPTDTRIWTGETTAFGDFIDGASSLLPLLVTDVTVKLMQQFAELTFAALDIVYDNSAGQAYVIEANSAPMSTPQTTKAYAAFFTQYAADLEAERLANLPKAEPVAQPTPVAVVEAAAPVKSREELACLIGEGIRDFLLTLPAQG